MEWYYKDICKEIGAPKQSLPGKKQRAPYWHCNYPALPEPAFACFYACWIPLPCYRYTYLSWFSSPWAGSWGVTHLLKKTALPLWWAPYLFLTWTLYSLSSTQTLPQDILLGVFFLSHPSYCSYNIVHTILIASLYKSPLVVPDAFFTAVPDIWNWFPMVLCLTNSPSSSKSQLKMYLFAHAYIS